MLTDDVKRIRKTSRIRVTRAMHRFLDCTADEIQAIMEHPKTRGLELMTGMVISNGIKKGDTAVMQWVLEYLIGKAPKLKDEDPEKRPPLPDDQLDARIAKLLSKDGK